MSTINWSGGQRLILTAGDTATCTSLSEGQIYGLFFFNSASQDNNAEVTVVWSNAHPPVTVNVPGSTGGQGMSSMLFVSGSDTQTISASISTSSPNSQVETWIGSVRLPTDFSGGLVNQQLPMDGERHSFDKYRRYYNVPPANWSTMTLNSSVTQCYSVQFIENKASVMICNPGPSPDPRVQVVGNLEIGVDVVIVLPDSGQPQTIKENIFGNGAQYVWMNSDSPQNSEDSTISLQSLSF